MSINDLSTVNAVLNSISFVLLITGYRFIKRGNWQSHKKTMLSALAASALFLISYLFYHYHVGSVPYPHHDWRRLVYFIILVPHIILAGVMVPFILIAVWQAFRENYQKHRRIARWVFPMWLYVSVSGVVVYFMLYHW